MESEQSNTPLLKEDREEIAGTADTEISLCETQAGGQENSSSDENIGEQGREVEEKEEDEDDDDDYDPELALSVPEETIQGSPGSPNTETITPIYASDSKSSSDEEAKAKEVGKQNAEQEEDERVDGDINDSGEKDTINHESDSLSLSKVEAESDEERALSSSFAPGELQPQSEPESDEDYDPEKSILPVITEEQSNPPVTHIESTQPEAAPDSHISNLQEAYEAVMQSEIVKSEEFATFSNEKQMEIIQRLLEEKQISLPSTTSASSNNLASTSGYPTNSTPMSSFRPDLSSPMTDEENEAYERFLEAEAQFLASSEELPEDSRLFVGNLPTNLVKKQDIFRLFSRYGELVEISLKTGYGFAQFRTVEACQACKRGEAGMPIYDRDLRLDASHRRKNNHADTDFNSRGRERFSDAGFQDSESKRFKSNVDDVYIIVTNEASPAYVSDVEQTLQNNALSYASKNIGNSDPSDEIRDAAYSGVLGVCVIKDSKVDLQIFEETSDGGVKFDEYVDVDPSSACELLKNAKNSKITKAEESRPNGLSRREDRANRWKRNKMEQMNPNFHDGSRGTFPQKPPGNFNYNDRNRDYGRRGNQQGGNTGPYSRPQNDWGHRPNHDHSYDKSNDRRGGRFSQYGPPQYNQGPGFNTGEYANNQPYGYGSNSFQNRGAFQGPPNQTNYGMYQNGHQTSQGPPQIPPQATSQNMGISDPALAQTLQNLDPNTMRSVVALLQQQSGPGAAPLGAPAPVHSSATTHQQHSSAQVNSLLAQLQPQPGFSPNQNMVSFNQQPQAPPPQSLGGTSQPANKSLMDMLSRLDGQ